MMEIRMWLRLMLLVWVGLMLGTVARAVDNSDPEEGRGQLDEIRESVWEEKPRPSPSGGSSDGGHSSSPRPPRNGSSDRDVANPSPYARAIEDEEATIGSWLFLYGLTAPWWGPYALLEGEDSGTAGFPDAPYTHGHSGYLVIDEDETTKRWGGRFSLDAADNFDDITTMTGRLQLDTVFRLGVDTEWASLMERRSSGADGLHRGDFNVVVRFAQSERAQFHSGIGVNWLTDRHDSNAGFNFTYGVDLFPVEPVVASATLDLGTIGHTHLSHFRGTIGTMIRPRLHLYTGYDLLRIGKTSIHSLLTGFELWF